jgi:exonuclease III
MSILSRNCRGLGNPRAVRDLCRMVKKKRPKLVFVMETKLQAQKFGCLKIKLGFDNVFVVDSVGKSGGLALFWSSEVDIEIQNFSRRHINAVVKLESTSSHWKFTRFYTHLMLQRGKTLRIFFGISDDWNPSHGYVLEIIMRFLKLQHAKFLHKFPVRPIGCKRKVSEP